MTTKPLRILVVCTHNACRSQMAEVLFRHLGRERVNVVSAGTEPGAVHPLTLRVLSEMGLDVSAQRSKHVRDFADRDFDFLITVCDSARQSCPVLPGAGRRIHWDLADPSAVKGTEEQRLQAFRLTRDLVAELVVKFLEEHK